ncbi:MAG: hypothetical protein LC109_12750 [Bacteroidia bacterium]|nr:hypothetical protein [Bacteroidia bacterium]
MKRIVSIIAMLSALSVAENLHAQCTDCEVKGINTDPRGSNAQNCEDANKINQFYWFNSQINAFYSYAGGNITGNLNSPFWAVGSQPIIGAHAGQTGSDFYPEDGWELLKFDNGYLADNITQRSTAKSMIYLCYYNKHRGLMRFFGMMPVYIRLSIRTGKQYPLC